MWIVTLGPVGYLPASGTFASLATCLILWPLLAACHGNWIAINTILVAGLILFSALDVLFGKQAIEHFAGDDPKQFVLDEAAGICLTMLFLPSAQGSRLALTLFLAFLGFRVFDITKPPPIRQLENLPHGWGILMDDLGAAVLANVVCQILLRVVIR